MAQWTVRKATFEDKEQILALHHRVFGKELSESQWNWQFAQNPTAKSIIYVAVTDTGKIVGHHCLVPVPFQFHRKNSVAGYSILSMIDPEFQRQGMLKALASASEEELEKDVTTTRLTFLNDNSLPVYTKYLEWSEIGEKPPIYFTVLDPSPVVAKKFGSLLGNIVSTFSGLTRVLHPTVKDPSLTVVECKNFDHRFDLLWEKVSTELELSTIRNANYLNWRYCQNPKDYTILSVERNKELKGFVVFRSEEKFGYRMGYIADLLFDPAVPNAGNFLLSLAIQRLRNQKSALVSSLVPAHRPSQKLYQRFHFIPLPKFLMPHGMHFCFKVPTDLVSDFANKNNWFLSWSDHDIV